MIKNILRILLGVFMITAAIGHFTFQREAFQAQVPNWLPFSKDFVVILSGVVEISLGLAIIIWKSKRPQVGIALAIFFVLIFPGNIAQYVNHTDAFGLDTDSKRLLRLFFQPILILCALWSTNVFSYIRHKNTFLKK